MHCIILCNNKKTTTAQETTRAASHYFPPLQFEMQQQNGGGRASYLSTSSDLSIRRAEIVFYAKIQISNFSITSNIAKWEVSPNPKVAMLRLLIKKIQTKSLRFYIQKVKKFQLFSLQSECYKNRMRKSKELIRLFH